MASTYISGLASGLDWQSLISQLVAVERQPITLLETNKTALSTKKTAWSDFNTNLLSLKTAADSLSSLDDFDLFTSSATVSGTTTKTVGNLLSSTVGSNASEGTYNITVNNLATAEKITSATTFTSMSDALGISGNVTINNRDLSIVATDSLTNIRDKINALNSGDNPAGVTASLVSVTASDYRLSLTSNTTGSAGISLTNDTLTTQLGLTQITAGQDANITLDDVSITRATNQMSDVISGVTLNLLGADDNATITLNVIRDTDGVKKKIQAFVDSYNKVMSYIATQNTVAATGSTANPLFGDTSLQDIKSTLRSTVLSAVSGLDSTLNSLGNIGVNIDKTGQLSINSDTLDGYLKSNFQDVANLFAVQDTSTGSKGVGQQLDEALKAMTDSLDGYVTTELTSLQSQMDNIDKKTTDMEARLTQYQDSLTTKFAVMETLLSKLQSQQSWLTSQIDALSSSS